MLFRAQHRSIKTEGGDNLLHLPPSNEKLRLIDLQHYYLGGYPDPVSLLCLEVALLQASSSSSSWEVQVQEAA